jgi:hypothetical protein
MSRPPHPPLLVNSKYTWRRVQIAKLLIMQLSPPSQHFIPLRSKYSPQHPVLKHPPSMVLPKFPPLPIHNQMLGLLNAQSLKMFCHKCIIPKMKLQSSESFEKIQNFLSFPLLTKNIKIIIHKAIILSVVLYGCETWSRRQEWNIN